MKHDIINTNVRLKLSREEISYTRIDIENVVRYFGSKTSYELPQHIDELISIRRIVLIIES